MEATAEKIKKKKKKVSKPVVQDTSEPQVSEALNVSNLENNLGATKDTFVNLSTEEDTSQHEASEELNIPKLEDSLEATKDIFKKNDSVNHNNENHATSSNSFATHNDSENIDHKAKDSNIAGQSSSIEIINAETYSKISEPENLQSIVTPVESDSNNKTLINAAADTQKHATSFENEPVHALPKAKESHRVANNEASGLDKYLNMNKQILRTLENIDSIPAQVSSVSKTKYEQNIVKPVQESECLDIKPYSEQQLSALYYNSELDMLEEFTSSYVEAELKCLPFKQHSLYDLLVNYLKVKEKITGNNLEIEQLRREYKNLQNELWTMETATVTGRAECQDGQIISASHNYNRSIFHRSVFQNIVRILGNVQKLLYENHILYSYSAEDLRLQIELYLQSVILNAITATQVNKNSPVVLSMQAETAHLKPYLSEIRLSISVLFAFQRKLIRDIEFLKETREWLTQLVAVLLRVANYQDHLFLINHILRCPAGVGTWASSFIQVPLGLQSSEQVFANYQINHLLSVLSVILSPVKERETFLKDIAQSRDVATEALWVLVDSDGEEDEENTGTALRENDLVALLNQLPLDDLFRCILLIHRSDNKDNYNVNVITEHHLLRFFAFCTVLLRLLHTGLQTYSQPRYNQFSKRLSRFIRHVVQYATDQFEQYLKVQHLTDQAMVQRLQTEYDAFFLRAIFYLYSSQKLGAWQFLAVVPYSMVTIKTVWKIFYFLHNSDKQAKDILNPLANEDFSKRLWDKELREQFEEKLDKLEDAEVYYLLNTFANMALARDTKDMDFIYAATMDLLQVGFISKATQETCSKSARILLSHLTSKHPHLLSSILKAVKENMDKIGSLALYLYEEIPLSIWEITDEDLEIIGGLLLSQPVNSDETKLARMILSRLNWNLLSYEKHCDTAILVVKAVDQEPVYMQWGWQTIMRLKLHISDKHFKEFGRVQELERYDILSKGIRENQPLSSFVAVLMTTWGHLVPLICTKGLSQLLLLQTHQKHEVVLFALYQIMPVFITSQECIINCEKFQEILVNLLNADRGYISYAKSFIVTQNTVLQQLGNMIETQIVNYEYYDLQSPRLLVRLWMNSLVSVPNWNKDSGILYLLDVVTRTAFSHQDSLEVIYDNLRELYKCGTPQDSGSVISIFKWVSSGNNSVNSLLSSSLASYPWLAYIFLEVEHQEREIRSGLWREILVELSKQKGKINVDNAIKKACSNIKVTPFSSGWLCLYRWAQQALDTPVNHPLLPLLWQKFFTLFLARIPTTSVVDKACVGERFFDGMINFTFLKKIKKRLQETMEFYRTQCELSEEEEDKKMFYKSCYKIFQAFLLWLEEPRLQEANLLLRSLPTQYESRLLTKIIEENNNIPWYEYLDYGQIEKEQKVSIKLWRVANFREKTNVNRPLSNPGSNIESSDPVERIIRRLASYDTPKKPPEIVHKAPIMPQIDFSNKETMFKTLDPCFKTLKQFAHNHIMKLSEHKALDCSYQELIPQLYRSVLNKVKKKVPCKGKNQTVHCSGAAVIVLEMQEARVNERIEHQIQANRNAYESLVEKSLQLPAVSLYTSSVTVQQCIRILQQQIKCNPATAELGVELFYYILSLLNEEISAYLPTKTLLASCIEKLGQSHICGVEYEMPRLLQWILKEPNLGGYLAPHFSPSNVGTSNMLLMYTTISTEMGPKYDIRFALLSKFEIDKWLNQKTPKLSQQSQFIGDVMKALCSLGYEPPIEGLMLHGLYRKHLLTAFEFQFPEHYGEVLMHLLKASNGNPETNLIATSVWMDILNSLAQPATIQLKAPLREQLRQYAQHQKVLNHQELLDSVNLLARHFTSERLQYGLYGLYPKCRNYIDVYVLLLGMAGHGLILSMLNTHQGLLGDKLCEKIWPYLREMFAPWLVPYSMQNFKDNMAAWIQQLADDRTILLPWIPSDGTYAQKIITIFFECVTFTLHTLPASTSILSYLWQWYVTSYAHTSVKDHILVPIHQGFSAFPWHNFWPSSTDLEFMLRVVDQYLPECHSFLGHVFISVPWANWINNFSNALPPIKSRVYHCFLNLLVKLSNEPNIRKKHPEKVKSLLVQAENFDWSVLEPVVYQHIMDWVVMSCDSGVIFKSDPLDLDYRLLHLLKTISGYNEIRSNLTSNMLSKRLIYAKASIKLLSVYVSRHKNMISSKQSDILNVILGYLNDFEAVVSTEEEMEVLLKELNSIINIVDISEIAVRAFIKWIQTKSSDGLIIKSLLKTLGVTVNNYDCLADLYEEALTSYFTNVVNEEESKLPTWSEASKFVNIVASRQADFEQTLSNKGSILTLNAILLQKVERSIDREVLLNSCIGWMENIKISESIESKVPLIWFSTIKLALEHCDRDEATSGALLYKFAQILLHVSEDRGGNKWGRGLLSAIGLSKQGTVSLNFRFICRAVAGYILAQLPEMKGQPQVVRRVENAPSRVGQPGGNNECPKVLLTLDFGQSQGKIKDCAELALNKIQDPTNSLHNAKAFLWLLLKQFYIKPYLKDIG